jgi:hypothetical protein
MPVSSGPYMEESRGMKDGNGASSIDVEAVEAELCRLPDVVAVRVVLDDIGRPAEVHVLATPAKTPKQVARDIQSVALASFGLDVDRRIISVVQLDAAAAATARPEVAPPSARIRLSAIQVQTDGRRTTFRVTLRRDSDEAVGFGRGSAASATRARLIATATLDALTQLEPTAESLDLDFARVTRVGACQVAVVTVLHADSPDEHALTGSAVVRTDVDDAVVRAVLDATNRRLPFLARRAHD